MFYVFLCLPRTVMLTTLEMPNTAMKKNAAIFAFSSCSCVGNSSREPFMYQSKDRINPSTKQKIQISQIIRMIVPFSL